ncbi:hypothetical protein VTK26DRAFT_7127 [Humicola hyalothermophila]
METINKIATAASEAIWGENKPHEEPVSGKLGNVAAGEPYDAGNIGGEFEPGLGSKLHVQDENPKEDKQTSTNQVNPREEPNEAALSQAEAEETAKPAETAKEPPITPGKNQTQAEIPAAESIPSPETTAAVAREQVTAGPEHRVKREEQTAQQEAIDPAKVPSATTDMPRGSGSGGGGGDSTNAQLDTARPAPREPEDTPTAKGGTAKANQEDDDDETAAAASASRPVRIAGPGPRPLEQVAREHGGDAGAGAETITRLPGEEEAQGRGGVL